MGGGKGTNRCGLGLLIPTDLALTQRKRAKELYNYNLYSINIINIPNQIN